MCLTCCEEANRHGLEEALSPVDPCGQRNRNKRDCDKIHFRVMHKIAAQRNMYTSVSQETCWVADVGCQSNQVSKPLEFGDDCLRLNKLRTPPRTRVCIFLAIQCSDTQYSHIRMLAEHLCRMLRGYSILSEYFTVCSCKSSINGAFE